MESTGQRGRIQLAQSTADLLLLAGKERWIRPREDKVSAKGKGTMQTYWLEMDGITKAVSNDGRKEPQNVGGNSIREASAVGVSAPQQISTSREKHDRLVGWMTEVLLDYVKQIVSVAPLVTRAFSTS